MMKPHGARRTRSLYLQAFLFCGLGCLLIGTAIGFPFAYAYGYDCVFPIERYYRVDHFEDEVSNTTRSVSEVYGSESFEAIDVRDFFTNGSPVILTLTYGSSYSDLNNTYYNFYNETSAPINLSVQFVPSDWNYVPEGWVTITVQWNNTPVYFSGWLFLRVRAPQPVCSLALNMTWIFVPVFLIVGLVLLVIGAHRWHRAAKSIREIHEKNGGQ